MIKTFHVALRDFLATVLTKGFIFGVLIMPLIMMGAAPLAMLLLNPKPPPVAGRIAFIDRTAEGVTQELETAFSAESIKRWVVDRAEEATQAAGAVIEKNLPADKAQQLKPMLEAAAKQVAVPNISAKFLPPATDEEAAKSELSQTEANVEPDADATADQRLLAIVVIDSNAVRADASGGFGTYRMFIRAKLDARVQGLIRSKVREAVITSRLRINGEDPVRIRSIMAFDPPDAKAVTRDGDKSSGEAAQMFVPLGFMMLLWISTFTGGQFLLTSTIEEKSNRIMEVLLSAVSPMQLMVGKIIGQMCAGLLILILYSGLGISGLIIFGQSHLLDWGNIALLVLLFLLAFGTIACLMAAIGSAVNDIHEAQSLMMPVTLIVISPMLLMMPIISDPKGVIATVMSFIPGVSPFVLVLRISSSDPPGLGQVALAIALNLVYVTLLAKLAAKIFRIGVLMYGKPPNFATLLRWIRLA